MLNNRLENMIGNIMENFDWEKCERTMIFLNWRWAGVPGFGIPNTDDLRKNAKYLIDTAVDGALKCKLLKPNEYYMSATGGLKATVTKNKYNQIDFINLEFVLTDWSDDGD